MAQIITKDMITDNVRQYTAIDGRKVSLCVQFKVEYAEEFDQAVVEKKDLGECFLNSKIEEFKKYLFEDMIKSFRMTLTVQEEPMEYTEYPPTCPYWREGGECDKLGHVCMRIC